MYKGSRTTAACYLKNAPPNLTVILNSPVAGLLLKDKQAIGVRTGDGREYHARRDVILSAGALNSPQILMLSGIGNRFELQKHGR
jgi:choline dehydrogenase-like flavoprotein